MKKSNLKKDKLYLKKYFKEVYKVNKKFFGFDTEIKIKLIYTRKEFDKEWGGKTQRWLCSCANNKRIAIFAPSVFGKLTTHKLKDFNKTLTHEVNHLFFLRFVRTNKPVWLMEGLAMNIDGTKYNYQGKPNSKFLFYTYKDKKYFKNAKNFYKHSYLTTKYLIKNIGRKKLLKMLKKYSKKPTKQNYEKIFLKGVEDATS